MGKLNHISLKYKLKKLFIHLNLIMIPYNEIFIIKPGIAFVSKININSKRATMKKNYLIILMCMITRVSFGQQNYCDFEGNKVIHFGPMTGVIDSAFPNPAANSINGSAYCAKYIRDVTTYDNIKI